MKKTAFYISATVLLASALSAAAPIDYTHVSADAQWVFHADLEAFRSSVMGTLVRTQLEGAYREKISSLEQLLGSDLTEDLDAITLYGQPDTQASAAALFYGTFNKEKLLSLATLNEAYSKTVYSGHTLHHWYDKANQRNQVGTFATDNLIIIAQTKESVIDALDVLSGKQKALTNQNLTLSKKLSKTPDKAIVVIAAEGLSDLTNGNPNAAVLKNSESMTATIIENKGHMTLQVDLEAEAADGAANIEQVLLGMKALMMLENKEHPQVPEMFSQTIIVRNEKKVRLQMRYPSAKLFELLQSLKPGDIEELIEEDHTETAKQ